MVKRNPVISKSLKVAGKPVVVLSLSLGAKSLVLVKARRGFVMCGYLNLKAAEKFFDAACLVKGVSDIEGLLNAPIAGLTSKAKTFGVRKGMLVREAIKFLS